MKTNVFLSFIVGCMAFLGCGQQEPVSSLVTQSEQEAILAKVTVTPFTAVLDLSDPSNPINAATCIQVDENGTVSFRRCVFRGPITGDLVGEERSSTIDLKVDANGNGYARGPFIFDVCHDDLGCGTFSGFVKGSITAGMFDGTLKAIGTGGDFVGLKMSGTSKSPGNGIFDLAGTIVARGK